MKVRLIESTSPFLVILAYKTSRGKVREKGLEHYLARLEKGDYDSGKLCRYLLSSAREWPSALEHVTFTFYIEGCSRVCSHQLVRHRLASYTQESQRYTRLCEGIRLDDWMDTNYEERLKDYRKEILETVRKQFIVPETWKKVVTAKYVTEPEELLIWFCELYNDLIKAGVPEEDARFILPMAVKTSLLMTVNLRELLHIAKLRLDEKAQWEIRQVVVEMIREVTQVIPCIEEMVEAYRG